jgi:hypothetical protein
MYLEEVEFITKLETSGLKVESINETEAYPTFQPFGPGLVVCVTGKRWYRIRRDVSNLLLNAVEFDPENGLRAKKIFDGTNTPKNRDSIADYIIYSEAVFPLSPRLLTSSAWS